MSAYWKLGKTKVSDLLTFPEPRACPETRSEHPLSLAAPPVSCHLGRRPAREHANSPDGAGCRSAPPVPQQPARSRQLRNHGQRRHRAESPAPEGSRRGHLLARTTRTADGARPGPGLVVQPAAPTHLPGDPAHAPARGFGPLPTLAAPGAPGSGLSSRLTLPAPGAPRCRHSPLPELPHGLLPDSGLQAPGADPRRGLAGSVCKSAAGSPPKAASRGQALRGGGLRGCSGIRLWARVGFLFLNQTEDSGFFF